MRFLIFCTDLPPIDGFPTSGTALRTYNLGEGLKELGCEVILSAPTSAVTLFKENLKNKPDTDLSAKIEQLEKLSFSANNQTNIIAQTNPDAIICGHWPAWTLGRKSPVPLIIDLAGPHLLERHFQGESNPEGAILGKLQVLSCADFFIASGQKQKLYFLSYLLRAKIPSPEKRIKIIPMPLPEISEDDLIKYKEKLDIRENDAETNFSPRFLFGGIFLPWQDPSWGLKKLVSEISHRNLGTLTLVGGPHPHYPIKSGAYESLYKSLRSNSDRITETGMLPYQEFLELIPTVDVALDLMGWNIERELAITIRTTSYLSAGVPIIYNNYSDLSKYIENYNAGWTVQPGDDEGIAKIIAEIFENTEALKEKSYNAMRLAKDLFSRKKAAQEILNLLTLDRVPLSDTLDISLDVPESCEFFLGHGATFTQKFVSRMDLLNKIELMLGTHNSILKYNLKVTLEEVSGNGIKITQSIEPSAIRNNDWLSIDFPPVEKSAGKEFALTLEYDCPKGEDIKLSPWGTKSSPYPLKGLYKGTQLLGTQSICLRTHSARAGMQDMSI